MVSIIIINYNTYGLTTACIRSIYAYTKRVPFEVILVDNASTECDPDEFSSAFPSIRLIKSEKNLGFAGGNNLGIQHSKGEHILLLNSDVELNEDSISISYDAFLRSDSVGFLGCRMEYPSGQVQYTARRFRSISWELMDLFRFIPALMPYEKRARRMMGKYFRHDRSLECDWLNGAFLLFSRTLLTGFPAQQLDDRFFMYAEDQLWCEQAKELGLRNYFISDTTIVHVNSGSSSIRKQLSNRSTMFRHELAIMRRRKGKGIYYGCFYLIYGLKEQSRNAIKWLLYQLTGRLIR
jgi:GT2 family glycosyltransferase